MGHVAAVKVQETELVEQIRRGELATVTTVMRRNNHALWRIARGILKDESEAEDAVQDAYVSAFTHITDFRGTSSLATWLSRITVNEALRRLRQRRPTENLDEITETLANDHAHATSPSKTSNPEHAAARSEIRRLLETAIDTLRPPFRVIFVLRVIEQMSIEETAEHLGIRPETVKTRLHRANQQLREVLGGELATVLDGIFPFAGARCERLQQAVLARLSLPGGVQLQPTNS